MIPAPYRRYTDNRKEYSAEGTTVGQMVKNLVREYPEMEPRLLDENGRTRSYVHIFIGERDIRKLQGLQTPVDADTVIKIIPAIAGG
jgi:adenylyltransferase/sulfurtransferase